MNSSRGNKNRGISYSSVSRTTNNRSRRRKRKDPLPFIIGGAVILLAIVIFLVIKFSDRGGGSAVLDPTEQTETLSDDIITMNAAIDLSEILPDSETDKLININGMTPEEISSAITDKYDWSLKITHGSAEVGSTVKQTVDANATTEAATMGDADNPDGMNNDDKAEETVSDEISVTDSIDVPDYIAEAIPAFLEGIVADDLAEKEAAALETESETEETKKRSIFGGNKEESSETEESTEAPEVYKFTLGDLSGKIAEIAEYADNMWYVEPHGGSIGSYDAASDTFLMENSRPGYKVNREELIDLITSAIASRDYEGSIEVPGETLSAESNITVGEYKTLASYTTETTSNSVRNKNIRLACEALNGTIVRPGEEFSFNNAVGQRTEEKGYGAAAAYNNGEVVQEVGGGVCQVSTTLYNAVLKAGLKITMRQSHTFQPTYVTPGQDATISWGGPDFRFANVPAIAEYSNSSSYAIGIRASYYDQTVTVSIYGRPVLKDGYTYSLSSKKLRDIDIVRELIQPGSDKTPTKGTMGSVWETRLVIKKDGETVSDKVDHNAYYAGHKEYYLEESPTESTTVPESMTESVEEIITDQPVGPGMDPTSGVIWQTDSPGAGPGGSGSAGSNTSDTSETDYAVVGGGEGSNGPGSTTGPAAPSETGAKEPSQPVSSPGAPVTDPGSAAGPSGTGEVIQDGP